ncbi:MAG: right-handed parallel beta-helix repeat-containing protein, partial [Gammaproteobacteria bacterium]|nr:right-handed parallel beta-helix repeat-containing protein [Gammaproteobacteria bacterium]
MGIPTLAIAMQLHVPSATYPTIQLAINLSNDDDQILIAPGTYFEHLIITKSITLTVDKSEKPGKVIINGGGQGRVIEIKASNVTISDLDITYSGEEVGKTDACIYVYKEARKVNVSNNRLSRCAFGIWVNGSKQIKIKGNTITGVKRKFFSDQGNGINIWSVDDAVVEYNDISNVRDGIYLT